MDFDQESAASCLAELELMYLHVGATHCHQLQDKSQLASFLLLGLRSQSLLRGMLAVLAEATLDAYDPVRRAFFEAWLLQFDFRFKNSKADTVKWFMGEKHSWKAHRRRVEHFFRGRSQPSPNFGLDYGSLSLISHPTFLAASNSCAIVGMKHKVNLDQPSAENVIAAYGAEFMGFIVQELWVSVEPDELFIDTHVRLGELPRCNHLQADYFGETRPS